MQAIAPDPYRCRPSGRSGPDVLRDIHAAVYAGHGTDARYGNPPGKVYAAPLSDFTHLLDRLCALDRLRFISVRDCLTAPLPTDRPVAVFRHDIDLDIDTAVQMAALEREKGIRASYYILHTAPYYGTVEDGCFLRHEAMAEHYRALVAAGHDVGLHTDPLGLVQSAGLDGLQAVETELQWLRDNGLPIAGTAAHNSYEAYGVENFAIFCGRPQRMFLGGCPPTVTLGGRTVALQQLDERALGLGYEANEVFWRTDVTVRYACAWNVDLWHWQDRRNMRLPLEDDPDNRPKGKALISTDDLLERCRTLGPGDLLLLAVHPVYFGARTSPAAPAPLMPPLTRPRRSRWRAATWMPGSAVVGVATDAGGGVRSVGINIADDRGMLTCAGGDVGDVTVLFVGSEAVDGRHVTGPAQCHCLLRARLEPAIGRTVTVRKHAHPDWSPRQCLQVLQREVAAQRPDAIVVEVNGDRLHSREAVRWFCAEARSIAGQAGSPVVFLQSHTRTGDRSGAETTGCPVVDPGGDICDPAGRPATVWTYCHHRHAADLLCAALSQALGPVAPAAAAVAGP